MFFEKLIEQHRVHRLIADGVNLAVIIAYHQVWIYPGYFFRNKAVLWRSLFIALVLEGHWFKSEDSFAGLVHRFNFLFKPAGGGRRLRPELAVAVDINRFDRPSFVYIVNASDKGSGLRSFCSNPDLLCVASYTLIANIDVVTACIEVDAGICAHEDVVTAGRETESGIRAHRNIGCTRCILFERLKPLSRVEGPSGAFLKRPHTSCCVTSAACVAPQRIKTGGGIAIAGSVVLKRGKTAGGIGLADRVV